MTCVNIVVGAGKVDKNAKKRRKIHERNFKKLSLKVSNFFRLNNT